MDELMGSALQHGFSIAVAGFLLIRMDKRMEEVTNALVRLAGVIESRVVKS